MTLKKMRELNKRLRKRLDDAGRHVEASAFVKAVVSLLEAQRIASEMRAVSDDLGFHWEEPHQIPELAQSAEESVEMMGESIGLAAEELVEAVANLSADLAERS